LLKRARHGREAMPRGPSQRSRRSGNRQGDDGDHPGVDMRPAHRTAPWRPRTARRALKYRLGLLPAHRDPRPDRCTPYRTSVVGVGIGYLSHRGSGSALADLPWTRADQAAPARTRAAQARSCRIRLAAAAKTNRNYRAPELQTSLTPLPSAVGAGGSVAARRCCSSAPSGRRRPVRAPPGVKIAIDE